MNREQLSAAARTVVQLDDYLRELKAESLAIFNSAEIAARGYITPSGELAVRQMQRSYWKARNALFELINDIRSDVEQLERATPQQFLVAFAAAALLVDAARFLRENFHRVTPLRRKLDEPDVVHGIPPRMYDEIQKSLTSPHHAWHLWKATRYYDKHRRQLQDAASADGLEPLAAIIDRLRERLRPPLRTYVRTRLHVRSRRTARRLGRDVLGRAIYAVQEAVSRGMSHVSVRPQHAPSVPRDIRGTLVDLLQPGDVLVVRKEFAATNYFLPGYWPHVALFLGTVSDLHRSGLTDHEHVAPRLSQLANAQPTTAVLRPNEAADWSGGDPHACVLESMKDGVRIRSINSPLNSDSVVVVRPRLTPEQIACAISRGMMHEGKPYDFDFDFCYSHRLVCTAVVYHAYEGVGGIQFDLRRHVGRFALAAGDIVRMALDGRHFELMAVYLPKRSAVLETGAAAQALVRHIEGV